jgi:hypothetical protein
VISLEVFKCTGTPLESDRMIADSNLKHSSMLHPAEP